MIKPIAIYLPQFHPIPENDKTWGEGFTEWTNVTKARPLFKGHYQPQLPADLGFYDLRLEETRMQQEVLAKEFGIKGFCYYHYWFNGKRILHEPLDRKLKNSKEDLPFMLFWANETWSRRWLGEERDIIMKQTYSDEDDLLHINWLIDVFKDSRYIKINQRPVFVIYRPLDLPDIKKTLSVFNQECDRKGVERPYFIASNSHIGTYDIRELGFDAILNFEPQLGVLPYFNDDRKSFRKFRNNLKFGVFNSKYKLYDYKQAKELMFKRKFDYHYFPSSLVNWDNTSRRGKNGIVLCNSSPEIFEEYMIREIRKFESMEMNNEEENLFFINAWNEWAEGNHLEPDKANGKSYLEAVRSALIKTNNL